MFKMEIEGRHSELTAAKRILRMFWSMVWLILYRPSPTIAFFWRRFLLRRFGAKIARDARPYPSAKIWAPWNLTMMERSCLASGVDCYSVDKIRLGRGVIVSQRAFLCSATHDYKRLGFQLLSKPIDLADFVWVGAEALIGPGIRMDTGAVAGARAVVMRHVSAWTVVAGNPAKPIGERPPESVAEF
jgi:putative colanic acid biosynthesis acetyltransferase WcaF